MSLADNLRTVLASIAAAATRAGREPGSVRLVAVTKTWPAETVREIVEAGQRALGENKVQELLGKVPELPAEVEWHLIGHLQQNKTRKILPHCALIHSIDSADLARQVSRLAGELGLTAKILLQVNVANDDAKFGFPVSEARASFGELIALPHLEIRGLMTVPPYDEDLEKVRPHFKRLRELRDELAAAHQCDLPELSMGMSHDFAIAIEEGATLVRIGSSIFGHR
jgi:pyridoxal phosphate enzyme (YggS family)